MLFELCEAAARGASCSSNLSSPHTDVARSRLHYPTITQAVPQNAGTRVAQCGSPDADRDGTECFLHHVRSRIAGQLVEHRDCIQDCDGQ